MKKLSNILLITDFSEVSENATAYAIQIAKKTNAAIHLLHVIHTPVDWVKIPLENEKLYPETKAEIGTAIAKLAKVSKAIEGEGIETHHAVVYNVGVENIVDHTKDKKMDLIVMGSHGSKGITEFSIGSNAQKVLRSTTTPLLIVTNKPVNDSIRNIVFATTLETNQKSAFDQITQFAEVTGAQLHILNINTPFNFRETPDIEERFQEFCSLSQNPCVTHSYNALNELRGITYFMEKEPTDIFSIACKSKSGLVQIFSSSLTESLINHLDIPILSIQR